jgi:hypothetical protein
MVRTDCKNFRNDKDHKTMWCDALKWNLEKGFTKDPCVGCVNYKPGGGPQPIPVETL